MTICRPTKLSCNFLTLICVSFYRDIANNQTSRERKIRRFLNLALWPSVKFDRNVSRKRLSITL